MTPRISFRFVIADDNVLFRELIVNFLRDHSQMFKLAGEVETIDAALPICRQEEVGLLLLNAQLFSLEAGSELSSLRRRNPPLRVLCYAGNVSDGDIIRVLQVGVDGFIGQAGNHADFLEAVMRISRGEGYFCARSSHLLANLACGIRGTGNGTGRLTKRETQVLRLIAAGRTSKQIAILLGLSAATVDTHRQNLMAKAQAHNAADLIRYGYSHDLITLALSEA